MNLSTLVTVSFLSLTLAACATKPQTREERLAYEVTSAEEFIAKGNGKRSVLYVNDALGYPLGAEKIRDLFARKPEGARYYREYLEEQIATASSPSQASQVHDRISLAQTAKILPEPELKKLFTALTSRVVAGNLNGSIVYKLGDSTSLFPELNEPDQQRLIVNRTISSLQESPSTPSTIAGLMAYVERVGKTSLDAKRIEVLLPSMKFRRDDLEQISAVYPTFAASRKEELSIRVFLQVKNGDRLLTDDLKEMLRGKFKGVEWVQSPGAKVTNLIIERVRNDEKTFPERKESVTYAQYEVNLLSAALLMPRNASYRYEVISGGAEIEYGYVVTAIAEGKTVNEDVVRGKVGGEYRRCENARIQNVFGGETSAGFTANSDMEQRCNGSRAVSMDELRKQVLGKVVDGVANVPSIKLADDLN